MAYGMANMETDKMSSDSSFSALSAACCPHSANIHLPADMTPRAPRVCCFDPPQLEHQVRPAGLCSEQQSGAVVAARPAGRKLGTPRR